MSNIKRYHSDYSTGGHIEEPDGGWVQWEDVAQLVEQNEKIHQHMHDAIALLQQCKVIIREGRLGKNIREFLERQRHQ